MNLELGMMNWRWVAGKIGGRSDRIPGYAVKRLGICSWAGGRCLQRRIGFLTFALGFLRGRVFSRSMWFSRKTRRELEKWDGKKDMKKRQRHPFVFPLFYPGSITKPPNSQFRIRIAGSHPNLKNTRDGESEVIGLAPTNVAPRRKEPPPAV